MRTTIALDDDLVAQAQAFTGLERKVFARAGSPEGAHRTGERRRLARLGGTERKLKAPPRRRSNQT